MLQVNCNIFVPSVAGSYSSGLFLFVFFSFFSVKCEALHINCDVSVSDVAV